MHSRLIAGQIPVMGMKSGNGLPGVWLQLARQFHRDGNDGSAKYSGNSARSVSSSGPKWTFEKTGLTQTSSGKDQVEGFQSREHEFSAGRSRDIQDRGVEHGEQDAGPEEEKVRIEKEKLDGHVRMKGTQERYENEVIDANGSPGVSLHSVMQSNVPEPFNPQGRNPTHLNMPGGGVMSSQKYLYDKIHKNHPSKQFSTSAAILGQAVMAAETNDYNIPCPQGVQGDDCVKFQLWLQNCQRYHLPNCDEQLQGIQTGRKTLAEIFNEQDALIRKISADFKSQPPNPEIQNLQDVQFSTPIQQSQIESYAPCPQGIQGEDCERYTQWLSNCSKYGLNNCADQLQGVQEGRRSLQSIFHEQEEMIRKIAFSNQTRSYSTSAPKGQEEGKEVSGQTSNPQASEVQLSQRHKLKRAVKDYGATVVVFHVGISLMSLGGFYLAVSSGIDMVSLLSKAGIGQSILESRLAQGASTFVVAYAVHKVFAPVRIGITLTCTPFIVRHLRRIGILKPPKVSKTQ